MTSIQATEGRTSVSLTLYENASDIPTETLMEWAQTYARHQEEDEKTEVDEMEVDFECMEDDATTTYDEFYAVTECDECGIRIEEEETCYTNDEGDTYCEECGEHLNATRGLGLELIEY
jgi:hypothetical protein